MMKPTLTNRQPISSRWRIPGRTAAFSLLEVLFALMVLTLGLIFVAAQFPIGLATSKTVAETTLHSLAAHNGRVTAQLELQTLDDLQSAYGVTYLGSGPGNFLNTDGMVHFWPRPNRRIDDGDLVMDDPTGATFAVDPPTEPEYSHTTAPYLPYNYRLLLSDYGYQDDTLAPENLGAVVIPPVGRYDTEVVSRMINQYGYDLPFDDEAVKFQRWQNTIAEIARERNYSRALLYQAVAPERFRLWVFTLAQTNKTARYAVQDTSFTAWDEHPTPLGPEQDRLFPVPWKVAFYRPVDPLDTGLYDPADLPVDYFILENHCATTGKTDAVAEILRAGSVLVDAQKGHTYTIKEIAFDADGNRVIRLASFLNEDDPLVTFWVFPPAIVERDVEPAGFICADQQPVINVTLETVSF